MRSLEKLWTVVYKIDQARQITSEGKPVRINPKTSFHRKLDAVEIDSIFELLQDADVITIKDKPSDGTNLRLGAYADTYGLEILPTFDKYMNDLYTRYSFGVDTLDDLSLLRVYDVALDVRNELQLTDGSDVTIRIIPPVIHFQALFPGDSIPMRDEYCRHRWNAINFLKKIGAFTKCELDDNTGQPYSTLAQITANRMEFDRVFETLQSKYRVTFGGKDKKELLPRPAFGIADGTVSFKGKSCEIAHGTCEYYICLLTFEKFGEKVTEQAVIDKWGNDDKKRTVYHAQRRLNDKIKEELGILKLFGYGSARVWIRAEIFEPERVAEKSD